MGPAAFRFYEIWLNVDEIKKWRRTEVNQCVSSRVHLIILNVSNPSLAGAWIVEMFAGWSARAGLQNNFAEMCSDSEDGLYLRLTDFLKEEAVRCRLLTLVPCGCSQAQLASLRQVWLMGSVVTVGPLRGPGPGRARLRGKGLQFHNRGAQADESRTLGLLRGYLVQEPLPPRTLQ